MRSQDDINSFLSTILPEPVCTAPAQNQQNLRERTYLSYRPVPLRRKLFLSQLASLDNVPVCVELSSDCVLRDNSHRASTTPFRPARLARTSSEGSHSIGQFAYLEEFSKSFAKNLIAQFPGEVARRAPPKLDHKEKRFRDKRLQLAHDPESIPTRSVRRRLSPRSIVSLGRCRRPHLRQKESQMIYKPAAF